MDARTTLRQQMQNLHGIMEAAIGDCPSQVVSRKLPDSTVTRSAQYTRTRYSAKTVC